MVAEERPALSDDEHAHDVEADHRALHVRFGQVRDRHPLERPAVGMLVGDALAGVGVDLAADEDQLAVLVGGYEVDGVLAVVPAVFEDIEAPELQVASDRLRRLLIRRLHDDDLLWLPARPCGEPCDAACAPVPGGCKGGSETR